MGVQLAQQDAFWRHLRAKKTGGVSLELPLRACCREYAGSCRQQLDHTLPWATASVVERRRPGMSPPDERREAPCRGCAGAAGVQSQTNLADWYLRVDARLRYASPSFGHQCLRRKTSALLAPERADSADGMVSRSRPTCKKKQRL